MANTPFDLKTEATRSLYAGVGAADRAVNVVRGYVADLSSKALEAQQKAQETVQHTVAEIDYRPAALRDQAVTVVSSGVEALAADAKARRTAIEARVGELSALATKQAQDAYADLTKRGETLVGRIRGQESSQATAAAAKTAVTKAKTTRTQAGKAAASTSTATKKAAKKTTKSATTTARKRSSTAASSAKATATAAKKTTAAATKAAGDAAGKVGD